MDRERRDASGRRRVEVCSDLPVPIPCRRETLPGDEVNRLLARNVPDGGFLDDLRFPADLADGSRSTFGHDWS